MKPLGLFGYIRRFLNKLFLPHEDLRSGDAFSQKFLSTSVYGILVVFTLAGAATSMLNGKFKGGIFHVLGAALLVGIWFILKRFQKFKILGYLVLSFIAVLSFHFLLPVDDLNSQYLFSLAFPLVALYILGYKRGSQVTLVFVAVLCGVLLLVPTLPVKTSQADFMFGYLGTMLGIWGLALFSSYLRARIEGNLHRKNFELERTIQDLKRTETNLRESESNYRSLFERSSDGIVILQDHRIILANPQAASLLGYELEMVIGKFFQSFIYPEDQTKVTQLYNQRMAGEDIPKIYELVLKHRDNHPVDVEVCGEVITFKGKPADLVVIRDITYRREMEKETQELTQRLEQAEKMELIGRLAGGVAHDLNNVLTGIMSYPDILMMQVPEKSPLRKPIQIIKNSGEKASAIVQDLLTLARRGVPVIEPVNLNDVLYEFINSPEFDKIKFYHPKVEFNMDLDPKLNNILGSPIHLMKTVMNLISNAAEAIAGVGRVIVNTTQKNLEEPYDGYERIEPDQYVVLEVSDNGMGMSRDDLEKIFTPFYSKKSLGRSGTGLGMTVVWGSVKDHKGFIDISTKIDEGTTFEVYFPVTTSKVKLKKKTSTLKKFIGKGELVLVVDDVKEQREILSTFLEKLKYKVITAANGPEAIKTINDNPVDLVLLDMILEPKMDGLDTYKEILKLYPQQKAIIISGFSETERVEEAQKLGATQYIQKPFSLQDLANAIRDELKGD